MLEMLAQDSIRQGQPKSGLNDSLNSNQTQKEFPNTTRTKRKKEDLFNESFKHEHRKFDSSLFTDIIVPSTSDYVERLGKIYQILSDIPTTIATFFNLPQIHSNLDSEDLAIDVVKNRLSQGRHVFNVRNLQMFNTLLDALDRNTDKYINDLDTYDSTLDDVREQISDLRRDTLMKRIFRDTSLKNTFQPELDQLKTKWREVDSLVTENGLEIDNLRSRTSAHSITIGELLNKVDMDLKATGSRAFQKEQPFLWEKSAIGNEPGDNFRESVDSELQLARFYFANNSTKRFLLPLTGILFFFWIYSNFRKLRKLHKADTINNLGLKYANPVPISASLIFMFSLAPLFDIHAPAIYIEFIQFLLMVFLIFILKQHVGTKLLSGWYIFIGLFIILSLSRILGLSLPIQRWITLVVDILAVTLGIYFLKQQELRTYRLISVAVYVYTLFNILAIVSNLFSRVTLSQVFSNTSFYLLAQTISLSVFVRLIVESFLLQVQTSRISKNYPAEFDNHFISTSIRRFSIIIAIILWLIVFTINLNLFDSINDILVDLLTRTRKVGNFNFTIGGILLFLGIIWFANFLQKYTAYFFGDTGDDAAIDDKGQRSRLMVTRLILLIAGFLLAVAASGLAVDRITVILGALGVGVGLGLQNIVNNFVSGVILIFDRPLRIGDIVDIGDKRGRVKGIGIRSSTLLTEDGAEVIIPNGDLISQKIVNWTLSNNHARVSLSIPIEKPEISDNIDLAAIKKMISENHDVIRGREPEILINPVNSKTSEIKIFFWVDDFSRETIIAGDVRRSVYKYLEGKGLVVD
jgi:small-conductance mechanosensitive channel